MSVFTLHIFDEFVSNVWRGFLICLTGAFLGVVYHWEHDSLVLQGRAGNTSEVVRLDLLDAKDYFDQQAALFVDARSPLAYANGHIPGAINIPYPRFESLANQFLDQLPKDTRIITYCSGENCNSGAKLARLIQQHTGLMVQVFMGGWTDWTIADFPVEIGETP